MIREEAFHKLMLCFVSVFENTENTILVFSKNYSNFKFNILCVLCLFITKKTKNQTCSPCFSCYLEQKTVLKNMTQSGLSPLYSREKTLPIFPIMSKQTKQNMAETKKEFYSSSSSLCKSFSKKEILFASPTTPPPPPPPPPPKWTKFSDSKRIRA